MHPDPAIEPPAKVIRRFDDTAEMPAEPVAEEQPKAPEEIQNPTDRFTPEE